MLTLSPPLHAKECVILLHGLARNDNSLKKLELVLKNKDYHTVNYNYPSTMYHVAKLAEDTISDALSRCIKGSKINFVTHSMGGILVRQYLSTKSIENMGRVVMLGPPNQGSQVVDTLKNIPGFKLMNGPAGMQLGTGKMDIPRKLGTANFDVGIIAGSRSINLVLSAMLPNPDDGKVSVENTKLEGMKDHITLPVTHPFMMKNDVVINQVVHYLKYGKFKRRKISI
ncbi:MAG: alpha/beta hydrolase [gamma proteobacterium symbiont of Taylorina sp.]|nr:alpha/beta hydrolase [gamma proteobacterium symbiont of Taylorina sp.]